MKKEIKFKNYYDEYLEVCSSVCLASRIIDLRKLLIEKGELGSCLGQPFGTCLIDYSSKVYSYLSDNLQEVTSYSREEYLKEGLNAHVQHFHPDDRVIFNEQLFRDIREFWKSIPAKEIELYRFSFTHRYFRNDGTISQFLQQSTYLAPNDSGIPILNLLTATDIGDFKTDTGMVLTISKLSKKGYLKVFSKTYHQRINSILSNRELEVLHLCVDGMSSKMIADKLYLSIQTIKNHRRNMLEKTSAKNIADLIHLSIKNNWI